MNAAATIAREIDDLKRRNTPSMREIRKRWSRTLRKAPADDGLATVAELEAHADQTGKWVAYELVRFHPPAFAAITEAQIEGFVGRAQSWYAVDALGTILTGSMWAKGQLEDARVAAWSMSPDRWLRRSALVLTVGLNTLASGGRGDAARTLPICRQLASDRVEGFLADRDTVLPARVKREVGHKLSTGLKTPGNRRQPIAD